MPVSLAFLFALRLLCVLFEIRHDHPGIIRLPQAPHVSRRSVSHSFAGTSTSVSLTSRSFAAPRKAEAEGDDTASRCAASWRNLDLKAIESVMVVAVLKSDKICEQARQKDVSPVDLAAGTPTADASARLRRTFLVNFHSLDSTCLQFGQYCDFLR